MEIRLCNIFKTTKAFILTSNIIERPYKVLTGLSKRTALYMVYIVFICRSLKLLLACKIDIMFVLFKSKVAKLHFLENVPKCLNRGQNDILSSTQYEITAL